MFFRSLAEAQGPAAIGIVLTGADSDGTLGLGAIKGSGGLTFAQDPDTAAYPAMPRHSIDARVVDLVLPIPAIAEELKRLSARLLAAPSSPLADILLPETERTTFNTLLDLLRRRTGVDFQRYKESTIQRRIARRMAILRINSLEDYLSKLQENPDEVDALYQDILIMVTQFFRDPETFEILQSEIFRNILQRKKDSCSRPTSTTPT